jgi:BolA protein
MDTQQRMDEMRLRLETKLDPVDLELLDEGHLHVGHAGAKDGRGHFRLRIVSPKFVGKTMMQRHRLVYQAMGDLMKTDIHALTIEAEEP